MAGKLVTTEVKVVQMVHMATGDVVMEARTEDELPLREGHTFTHTYKKGQWVPCTTCQGYFVARYDCTVVCSSDCVPY